jgi:protein FAM50
MINKSVGFKGRIFDYSPEPTSTTPKVSVDEPEDESTYDPLNPRKKRKDRTSDIPDSELEGFENDASATKVVDRRWYERNKHIFPASIWEEFDSTKDYTKAQRKDAAGNVFFFP